MSVITDKLNAEWGEKQIDEKQFAVRAEIESLYNTVNDFILRAGANYPTGDATFDAYVAPIATEITKFRNLLNGYAEFIGWRQP